MVAKIQLFKSYCYPIYECALWRHSYQNSIRKLTVSYIYTFKRLINVRWHTSSSLAFAMNATDHINVVFRKSSYSLMSRVTTSIISTVTTIFNSDNFVLILMVKYNLIYYNSWNLYFCNSCLFPTALFGDIKCIYLLLFNIGWMWLL